MSVRLVLLLCLLVAVAAACSSAASEPRMRLTPRPGPVERFDTPWDGASPRWPAATPSPTPVPTPSASPIPILHLPPYKVAIDAGHGGLQIGASYGDLKEKDVNMDIAFRLEAMLREAGYETELVRAGDYSLVEWEPDEREFARKDIQARVEWANREQADILVSIHHNGSWDRSQSGTEVYYNPDRPYGPVSFALADLTQQYLVIKLEELGYKTRDGGVKNDAEVHGDPNNPHSWLLGTNERFAPSLMPGIIGEALFISHPAEAELLRKEETRQAIAEAYKLAIDAYFAWLTANYLE